MSRTRNNLAKSNPWRLEPERYLELKHFSRQYPIWIDAYYHLDGLSKLPEEEISKFDPTCDIAIVLARYKRWIEMVDQAAKDADSDLATYIRQAVTEGRSYEYLDMRVGVPCCRNTFYDRCKKYFYLLDKLRE